MKKLKTAFTSPIGATAGVALEKANPKLSAKVRDFLPKMHRRVLRKFDMVPLLEIARKPEILTEEFRENKRQRALVASVRRRSIDG